MGLLDRLQVPLSWLGVIRRTSQRTLQDNCLGLAAELAFYFFLALFPALLFFVALASFFPIDRLTDHVLGALDRFTPPDVLGLIRDQLLQISKNDNGGLLTLGLVGTVWSASSGMSSVTGTLNQAYHVQEARSWWRVRLVAILLTIELAAFILVSFALVLVGPTVADTSPSGSISVSSSPGHGRCCSGRWCSRSWPSGSRSSTTSPQTSNSK